MSDPLLITGWHPAGGSDGGPSALLVRRGRIAWTGPATAAPVAENVLDAGGRTLIPGLIDVHVHGAGGADVMDGTVESLDAMARTLASLGTTAFLGTATVLPDGRNDHLRVAAAATGRRPAAAELLGLHLEGPFINPARVGGLPPECVWPPTPAAVDDILAVTDAALRMITLAPELDGGLDAVRRFAAAGVIPSLGHSDATCEEASAGIVAGIPHVTHLYNAMRGFHHREPGPLVAIHEAEHVTVQIVSDDVHVGRDAVRWTSRIFGTHRCVTVTDGIRTTGLPDGTYEFGGRTFISEGGTARRGDGALIGTSLPLLEIVRRFRDYTGCSLAEAVATATAVPARLLGLADRKGGLAVNMDADLVLLDADGSVHATLVAGEVVHRAA
ncbi:MAG TPA: N-acetylglucosamine-6-phosphate deacetylase [Longimicrobiales bacterium]|nr:N-acetylglucosamine-6-phosphate deacetylase [Longimicrobiales bacterium]